jgi:CRP-like cAMP-binding protein
MLPHPFFSDLSADHEEVIRHMLRRRDVAENEILVQQGSGADCAFFVTRGRIGVDMRIPGGGSARLTELVAGGMLGELALISAGQRRTATATALEPSEVLALLRRDLQALCAHHHPASLALLKRMAEHVACSLTRVSNERMRLGCCPPVKMSAYASFRKAESFDVRRALPQLGLAAELSAEEVDELVSLGRVWMTEPDMPLFGAGNSRGSLYVVIRGSIEVCFRDGDVLRRLSLLGPGEVAGDHTTESERTVGVVHDGATLLELPAQARITLADPDRPLAYRFAQALVRSLMMQLEIATRALAREKLGLGG